MRWGLVVDILEELLYLILDSLLIFKIYQFRCSILCAFSLDFLFLKLFLELVFEILRFVGLVVQSGDTFAFLAVVAGARAD